MPNLASKFMDKGDEEDERHHSCSDFLVFVSLSKDKIKDKTK